MKFCSCPRSRAAPASVLSRKFAESLTGVDFARRAIPQGIKPWIQRLGYGAARSRALSKPLQFCRELAGHDTSWIHSVESARPGPRSADADRADCPHVIKSAVRHLARCAGAELAAGTRRWI